MGAEEKIHLGIAAGDRLGDPLLHGHTAAEHKDLIRVCFLEVLEASDLPEHMVFGRPSDRAGVEDYHIRLLGRSGGRKAHRFHHAGQGFAVPDIGLASVGADIIRPVLSEILLCFGKFKDQPSALAGSFAFRILIRHPIVFIHRLKILPEINEIIAEG